MEKKPPETLPDAELDVMMAALGHRTPRHSLGDTPRRVKEEKMHEDRRACPARPPRGEGFREYTDNRRADTVQGRDASRHA